MPLLSKLFKGDRALEACLTSDSAHLISGITGDHIAKVHSALALLDGARIDPGEVKAKRYGASTAAAVLAYKTKRNIINPARQTRPDNIVGRLTIASLDTEMLAKESAPVPVKPGVAPLRVTVWINAFINKAVKDGTGGFLTFPLGAGPDRGKIVLPGPIPGFADCYLTDNRDFSPTITADARIHAEITIDFSGPAPAVSGIRPKVLKCSPSKRYATSSGTLLNLAIGRVKGTMAPDPATMGAGSTRVNIDVNLAANNPVARGPRVLLLPNPIFVPPLIPVPIPVPSKGDPAPPPGLDPDIDIQGTIVIDSVARTVDFVGLLDRFPFFEMYASTDGGATASVVFQIEPTPGDTPANLFGKANRNVTTILGHPARTSF